MRRNALLVLLTLLTLSGCVVPAPNSRPWLLDPAPVADSSGSQTLPASLSALLPTARPEGFPYSTPTPDAPRALPTLRTDAFQYVVQVGDSLAGIAAYYNLPASALVAANPTLNPDLLEIGQVLVIPAPHAAAAISDFKILPDSELVYGPASATLDIPAFVSQAGGYLATYAEDVEGRWMTGAEIVERVAYENSVNPRLLLALLEYQSGWVTRANPDPAYNTYPLGRFEPHREGLYKQLFWAADTLNRGYYVYQLSGLAYTILADGNLVLLSATVNPGTTAVQWTLGLLSDYNRYLSAISVDGLYATYTALFGIPFDRGIENLVPAGLTQPSLLLPFESGTQWSFTGGPHGGWGPGAAWSALDFAPPGEAFGCVRSDAWVTASADGVVVRAQDGAVVLDLDGDGYEQTGWTLLYMHIETRDRVSAGMVLKAGDRIGHPSCEGGYSNGTHVHLARRYNGEWISADRDLPFDLEGWISSGDGVEYDGALTRGGVSVIAWDGRIDENQIAR